MKPVWPPTLLVVLLFIVTAAAHASDVADTAPAPVSDALPASESLDPVCETGIPVLPCTHWASRPPTGPANEIHIAVNPNDPDHILVAGKDYGYGPSSVCRPGGAFHVASASYVTKDGGETWNVTRVPAPYPANPEPSPLENLCGSDPVVAFDDEGTAYYVLLNFDYQGGRSAAIAVARSFDGGESWPADEIRVLHESPGDDKQWGTVDDEGRVHVVWTDVFSGRIHYSRSDTDFDFETARTLAFSGSGNPAVVVDTDLDDEVYVLWRDGSQIRFTRSLNEGADFEPVRTAFSVVPYQSGGPPRLPFMPQIAVDQDPDSPYAGRIYVTWPDAREGDSSVWLASSGDGGLTWTEPTRVDDDPTSGNRQVLPTVSVAPGGRVDVSWMDERDDLGEPKSWRTYVSHSTDAGGSWTSNVPAHLEPMVEEWSRHQDGSVFIGDYNGIASTRDAALPAFPSNGADRLLEGLDIDAFERTDAYITRVIPDVAEPAGIGAPPSPIVSTWATKSVMPPDAAFLE